jgi:hypothetical protein
MDEESLKEALFDAIAAGRDSLRVAYGEPKPESGASFDVRFTLVLDEPTRLALHAEHKRRDVSVPRLVKQYVRECFYECLSDEKIAESELRAAA